MVLEIYGGKMMKVAIYPIRSPLHNEVMIEENSRRLLDDLL